MCGRAIRLFDAALQSIRDIPKPDVLLITKMFLGRDVAGNSVNMCLSTTTVDDPDVKRVRDTMMEQIQGAVQPLRTYIKLFDSYVEFLNADITDWLRTYQERKTTLAEDEVEITKLLGLRARVEEFVPAEINLGLFTVRCAKVKLELQSKYDQIIGKILCLIAGKASELAKNVAIKFAAVHATLSGNPETIEDVVEMEERVAEIPRQTAEVQVELDEMLAQMALLDTFSYHLSDDESSDKWNAYGWPKKIQQTVERVQEEMLQKRATFRSSQEREQDAFISALDTIEATVSEFHRHDDVNNLEHIAAEARRVSSTLAEYAAKAKQFNSREVLYGEEMTDYDRLSRTTKMFEPYAQLWIGIDDWRRWQVSHAAVSHAAHPISRRMCRSVAAARCRGGWC